MKQFLLSLIILFLFLQVSFATHIVGGELTYELTDSINYNYRITLKLYRDCLGIDFDPNAIVGIYDTSGNLIQTILLPFPGGDTIDPNPANDPCLIIPDICVEEAVYTGNITLPPISGGYNLVYQRCCRRFDIANIVDPGNVGLTLLTHILDTTIVKYNSDPIYNDFPPVAICVNEDVIFDHSATDIDGDSLVYGLCSPFEGGGSTTFCPNCPVPNPPLPPPHNFVTWVPPYSDQDPLGGLPLSIDSITGLLSGRPNTVGKFVVGVCVKEYRNGILLSENKRDFQFNVVDCLNPTATTFSFNKQCGDLTVNFPDSSTAALSYWWNFGNPLVLDDTSNIPNPSYTYPDTGLYNIVLIVNKGTACADTAYGQIELKPALYPGFLANFKCVIDPAQFTDTSKSELGNIISRNWNFGDGSTSSGINVNHLFIDQGPYIVKLIVQSEFGCLDSVSLPIDLTPRPTTTVSGNNIICFGESLQISLSGGTNYLWTPNKYLSNSNIPNPVITPEENIIYIVNVSDTCGLDTVIIDVKRKFCGQDIPNAFSPNGDGDNDVFKIQGEGITNANLKIYDRWGIFIFSTEKTDQGWDGTFKGNKLCPAVFVYYLTGSLDNGDEFIKFGNVTLVK